MLRKYSETLKYFLLSLPSQLGGPLTGVVLVDADAELSVSLTILELLKLLVLLLLLTTIGFRIIVVGGGGEEEDGDDDDE